MHGNSALHTMLHIESHVDVVSIVCLAQFWSSSTVSARMSFKVVSPSLLMFTGQHCTHACHHGRPSGLCRSFAGKRGSCTRCQGDIAGSLQHRAEAVAALQLLLHTRILVCATSDMSCASNISSTRSTLTCCHKACATKQQHICRLTGRSLHFWQLVPCTSMLGC